MKKLNSFLFLFLVIGCSLLAQDKPIKNMILLIPDGTSLSTVSAARWYQRYNQPEVKNLFLDPYLCGTILTYSSNAPIGDSAPTTSCYMTGYPSRAGWVATYPVADPNNDIVPIDPERAYQPMMTLLEAARIVQNKATGLVFTCEFPHATPADCSSHSYDREKYTWIAPQMVHNNLDIVIGGGTKYLTPDLQSYLKQEGYGLFFDDINGFRNYPGNKMWALFHEVSMPYDIDRNAVQDPSLAEMTRKAIEKLSQNETGFFLMVEGSKVDWAAHANDAVALMTDFLAFDQACGVAFDFAEKNGETLVVVVPDHGNSGFSIGVKRCNNYSTMTKDELWGPVSQFKTSREVLINTLRNTAPTQLKEVVYDLTGISLSDMEYQQLLQGSHYNSKEFADTVASLIQNHICFGFTTPGHTGEEVFLAVYDPRPNRMTGHHTNIELNHYMRQALGLEQLEALTDAYFAKHSEVFNGYTYTITHKNEQPVLEVKHKKTVLEIEPYTNIVRVNGKAIQLNSVIVYVDKNQTFYLPKKLRELLV